MSIYIYSGDPSEYEKDNDYDFAVKVNIETCIFEGMFKPDEINEIIYINKTNSNIFINDGYFYSKDIKEFMKIARKCTKEDFYTMELNNENYKEYIKKYGFKQFCEALKNNKSLEFLYLHDAIDDKKCEYLVESLQFNKYVIYLNLDDNKISKKGIKYITKCSNSCLISLYISNCNIGKEGSEYIAEFLKNNKSLKNLFLNGDNIGDEGAKYIADALVAHALQRLTSLNLGNNNIGDEGVKYIAEALKICKLKSLYLYYNNISSKGTKYIAEALVTTSLEELDLDDNKIGDIGAKYIAESLNDNKFLIKLFLNGNNIFDKGAEYMINLLKVHKQLTTLYLHNNGISNKVIRNIMELININKSIAEKIKIERVEEKNLFIFHIKDIWQFQFIEFFDLI